MSPTTPPNKLTTGTPPGETTQYKDETEKLLQGIGGGLGADVLGVLNPDSRMVNIMSNIATITSGFGTWGAEVESALGGFDKFGINTTINNHVISGYTFITRPDLMMVSSNLKLDRTLYSLVSNSAQNYGTSIRGYLDPNLYNRPDSVWRSLLNNCPYINNESPFIVPLSNCLRSISGFPDFVLDTLTTSSGWFEEDQTTASGSDFLCRSYDLSLEFIDIPGSYILALLYSWVRYVALATLDRIMVYRKYIWERVLCYTSSIYRFVLDPSRRQIIGGCKCTGCFPKTVPLGAYFDVNEKEHYVHAAERVSCIWQANNVEYFDYMILKDFNSVVDTWFIENGSVPFQKKIDSGEYVEVPLTASFNFVGIPYIDLDSGFQQLRFYAPKDKIESIYYIQDTPELTQLSQMIENKILDAYALGPTAYQEVITPSAMSRLGDYVKESASKTAMDQAATNIVNQAFTNNGSQSDTNDVNNDDQVEYFI